MIYKKYYLYKEQVSLDNGVTWEDVTPAVTRPDGDPIGEYATLEECEGIAPLCDCSAFTPSLSITVPSNGGTVTLGTFSDDCLNGFSYSFTTPTGMITSAAVSAGTNVSAYTATISSNTSSSSRTGTITVTYNAGQDSCSTSVIPISQSGEEPQPTCDCDSFAFTGTEEVETNYITVKVKNNTGNAIYVDHIELHYANGGYDDEHDFGSIECDGSSATTTLTDQFDVMAGLPQTVTGATIDVCHSPQCSNPGSETVTFNPDTLTNEGDIITLTFNG